MSQRTRVRRLLRALVSTALTSATGLVLAVLAAWVFAPPPEDVAEQVLSGLLGSQVTLGELSLADADTVVVRDLRMRGERGFGQVDIVTLDVDWPVLIRELIQSEDPQKALRHVDLHHADLNLLAIQRWIATLPKTDDPFLIPSMGFSAVDVSIHQLRRDDGEIPDESVWLPKLALTVGPEGWTADAAVEADLLLDSEPLRARSKLAARGNWTLSELAGHLTLASVHTDAARLRDLTLEVQAIETGWKVVTRPSTAGVVEGVHESLPQQALPPMLAHYDRKTGELRAETSLSGSDLWLQALWPVAQNVLAESMPEQIAKLFPADGYSVPVGHVKLQATPETRSWEVSGQVALGISNDRAETVSLNFSATDQAWNATEFEVRRAGEAMLIGSASGDYVWGPKQATLEIVDFAWNDMTLSGNMELDRGLTGDRWQLALSDSKLVLDSPTGPQTVQASGNVDVTLFDGQLDAKANLRDAISGARIDVQGQAPLDAPTRWQGRIAAQNLRASDLAAWLPEPIADRLSPSWRGQALVTGDLNLQDLAASSVELGLRLDDASKSRRLEGLAQLHYADEAVEIRELWFRTPALSGSGRLAWPNGDFYLDWDGRIDGAPLALAAGLRPRGEIVQVDIDATFNGETFGFVGDIDPKSERIRVDGTILAQATSVGATGWVSLANNQIDHEMRWELAEQGVDTRGAVALDLKNRAAMLDVSVASQDMAGDLAGRIQIDEDELIAADVSLSILQGGKITDVTLRGEGRRVGLTDAAFTADVSVSETSLTLSGVAGFDGVEAYYQGDVQVGNDSLRVDTLWRRDRHAWRTNTDLLIDGTPIQWNGEFMFDEGHIQTESAVLFDDRHHLDVAASIDLLASRVIDAELSYNRSRPLRFLGGWDDYGSGIQVAGAIPSLGEIRGSWRDGILDANLRVKDFQPIVGQPLTLTGEINGQTNGVSYRLNSNLVTHYAAADSPELVLAASLSQERRFDEPFEGIQVAALQPMLDGRPFPELSGTLWWTGERLQLDLQDEARSLLASVDVDPAREVGTIRVAANDLRLPDTPISEGGRFTGALLAEGRLLDPRVVLEPSRLDDVILPAISETDRWSLANSGVRLEDGAFVSDRVTLGGPQISATMRRVALGGPNPENATASLNQLVESWAQLQGRLTIDEIEIDGGQVKGSVSAVSAAGDADGFSVETADIRIADRSDLVQFSSPGLRVSQTDGLTVQMTGDIQVDTPSRPLSTTLIVRADEQEGRWTGEIAVRDLIALGPTPLSSTLGWSFDENQLRFNSVDNMLTGSLALEDGGERWLVNLEFQDDEGQRLATRGAIYNPLEDGAEAFVRLDHSVDWRDVSWIALLTPDIAIENGHAQAEIRQRGTLMMPTWGGQIVLEAGSVQMIGTIFDRLVDFKAAIDLDERDAVGGYRMTAWEAHTPTLRVEGSEKIPRIFGDGSAFIEGYRFDGMALRINSEPDNPLYLEQRIGPVAYEGKVDLVDLRLFSDFATNKLSGSLRLRDGWVAVDLTDILDRQTSPVIMKSVLTFNYFDIIPGENLNVSTDGVIPVGPVAMEMRLGDLQVHPNQTESGWEPCRSADRCRPTNRLVLNGGLTPENPISLFGSVQSRYGRFNLLGNDFIASFVELGFLGDPKQRRPRLTIRANSPIEDPNGNNRRVRVAFDGDIKNLASEDMWDYFSVDGLPSSDVPWVMGLGPRLTQQTDIQTAAAAVAGEQVGGDLGDQAGNAVDFVADAWVGSIVENAVRNLSDGFIDTVHFDTELFGRLLNLINAVDAAILDSASQDGLLNNTELNLGFNVATDWDRAQLQLEVGGYIQDDFVTQQPVVQPQLSIFTSWDLSGTWLAGLIGGSKLDDVTAAAISTVDAAADGQDIVVRDGEDGRRPTRLYLDLGAGTRVRQQLTDTQINAQGELEFDLSLELSWYF